MSRYQTAQVNFSGGIPLANLLPKTIYNEEPRRNHHRNVFHLLQALTNEPFQL